MLKFLKPFLTLLVLVMVLLLGSVTGWIASSLLKGRLPGDSLHAGLTVERLSEVSELLTLKIDLADVLVSRIDGYTGGVQAVLLMKGDVSLGVDLAQARFEKVDPQQRTATLILPAPTGSQARLDHRRTRVVSLEETGLWSIAPGTRAYQSVVNKAMGEGEALLLDAANATDADHRARGHAEVVLSAFCRSLGWQLQVHWADQASGP